MSRALALAFTFAPAAAFAHGDWAQSSYAGRIQPAPNQLRHPQAQNPPAFAWHKYWPGTTEKLRQYIVEVQSSDNSSVTFLTGNTRNVLLPTQQFAAGTYKWRVGLDREKNATASTPATPISAPYWSDWRDFVIDESSRPFIVPESADLQRTVRAHPRPRQLSADFALAKDWPQNMLADRAGAFTALTNEVVKRLPLAAPTDALWSSPPANVTTRYQEVAKTLGEITRQLEAAALLFRLTHNPAYLKEAIARGNQLSALDINGATGFVLQDQVARAIALSLAKGADFLWNDLDVATRTAWLTTAVNRSEAIYNNLAKDQIRLDWMPFDSHGVESLGYLALISTLALGEVPQAEVHFDFSLRSYANILHVWSGPEGGYANGTAYAQYTTDVQLQTWPALAEASGVNLFDKPWSAGLADFFMQFTPPGAPSHVFGDVHEAKPDARLLKAYVSRQKTPQAAWYAANASSTPTLAEQESPITLLQAPYPLPVAGQIAEAPKNAAFFPSIGWVAMHSNIADLKRTSVYFKSSPYGSYNHSHGDQNSLVIHSGGLPLLIEAGAQDYYASPQAYSWYRTTKAHNAITYDNGIGQVVTGNTELLLNKGALNDNYTSTPSLDYAEGDAPAAYGAALTTANRKLWYVREHDTVVVLDTLASPTAKKFEWNMHALSPIGLDGGSATIQHGGRSLCLRSLDTDGTFLEAKYAPTGIAGPVQSHAAFVKPAAALQAEFLVVLDVACKAVPVRLDNTTAGRQLTIGGKTIHLPQAQ